MAKPLDETKYGFSEDDNHMEDATKELMHGFQTKDYALIMQAIEALVQLIKSKHTGEQDVDALENP